MSRRARARGDERGIADLVVVFPALLILFLVGVQVALTMHARHVLMASAQDAATAAARVGADASTATDTAQAEVARFAPHLVQDVTVTTSATPASVTVTLSADVESILGFLKPHVVIHASAPWERFIPEPQR